MKRIRLPRPTGKYPVGLRHTGFSFSDGNGATPISLTIFYPAFSDAGTLAPYAFPQVLEPLELEQVDTACRKDAPLAKGNPFPLVLFNHGYLMYEMCSTVLCSDLASCGYVVAAIGHTEEGSITMPDGTFIPKGQRYIDYIYAPQMMKRAGELLDAVAAMPDGIESEDRLAQLAFDFHALHNGNLNDSADIWEQHTLAAAAYIRSLNDEVSSFLHGRLDLAKGIGLTGHSFGGATAANCCAHYDLFPCGIDIDGAQLGSSFGNDIGKPFLTISGNDGGKILRDMYKRNSADSYHISICSVEHYGLTDRGILGLLTGKSFPGVGEKNPMQVRAILRDYHLAFFAKYLLGEEGEMPFPDDADIEFQRKPGRKGVVAL